MRRRRPLRLDDMIAPMFAAMVLGIAIGWLLRSGPPQPAIAPPTVTAPIVSTDSARDPVASPDAAPAEPSSAAASASSPDALRVAPSPSRIESGDAVDVLKARRLRLPIVHVDPESLKGAFYEGRTGDGGHTHEAVDLLAPRQTPIHAVEDGTIARLFESKAGGHTIYQFDPAKRFVYYYAHLDHYADGLHEGDAVAAGEVIGYVGTSGNAPPNTPHLHFAIFELGEEKRWWEGRPLDPYLVFRR